MLASEDPVSLRSPYMHERMRLSIIADRLRYLAPDLILPFVGAANLASRQGNRASGFKQMSSADPQMPIGVLRRPNRNV